MQIIPKKQTMASSSSKSLTITTSMSISCHKNLFSILLAIFFIIFSFHTAFASSNNTTNSIKTYKTFIKQYCNSTSYPSVCYKSLSPYASVIKTNSLVLTKSSIYLALKETSKASSSLKKLSKTKGLTHGETQVIRDCLENINDAFDEVKQCAIAIKDLNGTFSEERFQWSNIQTWMSAAITDDSTCTDEFDEMAVRASLQKKIKSTYTKAESLIKESLALVNKYCNYY